MNPVTPTHTSAFTEYHLSSAEFARICQLIYERAGIALGAQKQQLVYSRLSRRVRELKLPGFADYLRLLESDAQSPEWQQFINALTTNLTAFFREAHPFPVLAQHVPRLAHPVRVWCSAASTGEEPYSIAMTLVEALGSRAGTATVVATDIDTQVLAQAEAGVFTLEQVAKLSPERLRRFFLKGSGVHAGKVRVRPELAALVKFAQLNLLESSYGFKEPFDAIFCRNVMIYFDRPTQARVLERFVPVLRSDGLLFAGHSENFSLSSKAFKLRGQTIYERVKTG
jgi:chemotaxis protein methyltransferase CheR